MGATQNTDTCPLVEKRADPHCPSGEEAWSLFWFVWGLFFFLLFSATKQFVWLPPSISSQMCWPQILGGVGGCDHPVSPSHSFTAQSWRRQSLCCAYPESEVLNTGHIGWTLMGRLLVLYGRHSQDIPDKNQMTRDFAKCEGAKEKEEII